MVMGLTEELKYQGTILLKQNIEAFGWRGISAPLNELGKQVDWD